MRGFTRGLAAMVCWLSLAPAWAWAATLGLSAERIEFGHMKEGMVAERAVVHVHRGKVHPLVAAFRNDRGDVALDEPLLDLRL